MADFEPQGGGEDASPRETRRDPGVTRRDAYVPGPRPAQTRRDGTAAGDPLMRLPAVLAERFETVAELPVQGAESDLLLVRDARGVRYVVKLFRRGFTADRDVWGKLPELDSPHVVRVLETGHAEGRDYEITEYAPAGNLRAALAGGPLPPEMVAEVAAQLADGLAALHRAGIVHRDLKPENVLVTGTDPVRVAITDFGLSRVLEQSVVFASASRTLAYAAPESLSGQVSPARDWWSLGMILRELATGRPPFAGLSETAVIDHLATRPVTADDVADPRLRLLCRGLLTRDPRRRWGAEQVAQWLDGASPPVAEPARPVVETGPGVPFAGRRFTDRGEFARALVERWDQAARYFFGGGQEAFRVLREWLSGLPDDSRIELVDGPLSSRQPPDVKLLHLVRWLDPSLPPHYLGRRVTADDLAGLAALAGDGTHPDHRTACLLGRDLWEHRLLHVLAGFDGAHDLARIDEQWRAHVSAWNDLARWLRTQNALPAGAQARLPDAGTTSDTRVAGPPVPADDPPVVLLTLLALAVQPGQTRQALSDAAARARAGLPEPVPWLEWLADGAGDDPLRLLAVARTAPEAVLELEARSRDARAAEQRAQTLREWWAERERQRLAGRNGAVARAVGWTLPILAFWLLGSWVVGALFGGDAPDKMSAFNSLPGSGVPFGALAVLSVVAWVVQCGCEILLARVQGRDYLPYGPWSWLSRVLGAGGRGLSKASQAVSGAARRTSGRGCGVLLLAGTIPLLLILLLVSMITPVASLLWLLLLVAGPAAHAVAAGVRLHRWRQQHAEDERRALA
ncbi:serine/threonine-protein kinase [Actinomadura sp. NBRC 104425]|uniref:protein kinase domain-containing protein n=1 Tax=Actinomadura sp. NBRC 104425 TaxID=3032204 RepID=UPI002552CE4E|nr:serine/threonine-protein kinase [Actinomadura sp. NBRC 104425]